MVNSKLLYSYILIGVLACLSIAAVAESTHLITDSSQGRVKPFIPGSYQKILSGNENRPFMLVMWSLTCSSCLQEMELLSAIHKNRPELKIIMVATDDAEETAQIQSIIDKHQLSDIENWVYADQNPQKLQYEIDPNWYGEQPRNYFFNPKHQREGISGALSMEDYENIFEQFMKLNKS